MSLDERMSGVLSANRPIDTEFCERVGMVEQFGCCWEIPVGDGNSLIVIADTVIIRDEEDGEQTALATFNTQGRFLHLLAALGIEVPR